MKKIITLFAILLMISIGCKPEPEPEPPQTLAEFVIGSWVCTRQTVQTHQADLYLTITEQNYTLRADFSSSSIPDFLSSFKDYQITEQTNRIQIDYPYSTASYTVVYEITWEEGKPTNMKWVPLPTNQKNITSDPISLYWIKN